MTQEIIFEKFISELEALLSDPYTGAITPDMYIDCAKYACGIV